MTAESTTESHWRAQTPCALSLVYSDHMEDSGRQAQGRTDRRQEPRSAGCRHAPPCGCFLTCNHSWSRGVCSTVCTHQFAVRLFYFNLIKTVRRHWQKQSQEVPVFISSLAEHIVLNKLKSMNSIFFPEKKESTSFEKQRNGRGTEIS